MGENFFENNFNIFNLILYPKVEVRTLNPKVEVRIFHPQVKFRILYPKVKV